MPYFKVPFHQHSFNIHELDSTISFPLATSAISPTEHLTSSSNVHVESPMSSNKHVDLNDLQDTKSDPNLLHQCPSPQKFKKSYDHTCKFQFEWVAKLPWVEGVLVADGILHNVFCRVSSIIDKKPLLLAPKWDTLMKHEGRKKANEDLL